jgi:hypothetical protein
MEDLARRGDLDFDDDVGVLAPEAAECVGKQVDAGGRRGSDVDRSRLETGERVQLLLPGSKGRQRLSGVGCQHPSRFGQAADPSVSLHEALPCGGFEQAKVLARRRLPDAHRPRGGRDAALPVELDEQPHPRRVPKQRKRRIGHADTSYRRLRLAR